MNMAVFEAIPETREKEVTLVLNHWLELRTPSSPIPLRTQIDPIRIPAALPYMWIAGYDRDQDDFYIRLSGEHVNLAWEKSIGKQRISDFLTPERVDLARKRWHTVLDNGYIIHGFSSDNTGAAARIERLLLPLGADEQGDGYILGVSHHGPSRPKGDDAPPRPLESLSVYRPHAP